MALARRLRPVAVLAAVVAALWAAQPAAAQPSDDPVVRAVQRAVPAVVNISTMEIVKTRHRFGDPFFDRFFSDFFDRWPQEEERLSSLGSGVIIDGRAGHVLTNHHVVANASKVTVTLSDGSELPAVVIGSDPASDLAVLKIDTRQELPTIELGDSDKLMIGQRLIAIGNPFGLSHTVTTGVLSAVNRTFRVDGTLYFGFLQTDAAINPGNSGGALLDDSGRLVGINTAIYARAEGIGFAIPINKVRRIAAELINHGRVRTPWLGLSVQTLTAELRAYFPAPQGKGVIVTRVESDSPAERAGLYKDDVVIAVGAMRIASREGFHRAAADYPPGYPMNLTVFRGGRKIALKLTPTVLPAHKARDKALSLLGFLVERLDYFTARKWGIPPGNGVKVSRVLNGSPAARIGLRRGDVLLAINDQPVDSPEKYSNIVAALPYDRPVVLIVQRGNTRYRVHLRPAG